MQILILILQIVFIALGILGFFYIKNLLPSYFSEKGKNLATKEDIEEITEKIKSVETKIKIKESSKIEYDALKRETVLEYFGTLNSWQNVLLDMVSDISSNCDYHNSIKIQKIEDIYLKYNIKQEGINNLVSDQMQLQEVSNKLQETKCKCRKCHTSCGEGNAERMIEL